MARSKQISPTLLITKDFILAFPAAILVFQNPISKYEQKPTPSHPTNKINRSSAHTIINIKKVNNDR